MKRALVMMDMSGLGRCALSVALPVLSAMGAQAVPLPTALLSAHTGGFGAVHWLDLTKFLDGSLAHYERLGARFDAVYAGYLASDAQVARISRALDGQVGALALIDPVMADHGKYYAGIGPARADAYRALCARADLVTPNATEARLLVGADADAPVEALLAGLLALGCGAALVKGAELPGGARANAYQARGGRPVLLPYQTAPGSYPGTGDLFASVLLGALLRGTDPELAIRLAADFVRDAVIATGADGSAPREGVRFEPLLGRLVQ